MKDNVDGITKIWTPDKIQCDAAEAYRAENEWLRQKNGIRGIRPSNLGIEAYRWGHQLHPKFYEGRNPPPVPLDSLENIEWYTEQLERCVYGFEYKGQRITGDHYWFLNFTPFLVAKKDKYGRVTTDFDINFPYYSLMHDYLFKTIEEAHYEGKGFSLMGGRGFGKEQPHYEVVMTPDGETTMGAISPGDYVIGSDGKPKKVLQKHPQGLKDVYRVHLSDGRYADCGINHLWGVKNRKGKYKVIELKDLIEDYLSIRGDSKYFIETSKVDYEHKPVSIDPYLLGLLIGDGGLTQGVRFSTEDVELLDKIKEIIGSQYSLNHLSNYDYSITYNINGENPLYAAIRQLGLNITSHNKFIPQEYKVNSEFVRMEMLKGLMDSDGTIGKNGVREFYSVSRTLANDVAWLARSLGMKAVFSTKYTTYKGEEHLSYRVRVYSNVSTFKLTRKKSREKFSRYKSQLIEKTGIVNIEKLSLQYESSCITVDADDSLYLTKDFIQTHNTYIVLSIIAKTYHLKPKSHGIVSASHSGHAGEAFTKLKTMLDSIGEVHPTIALARLQDTKFMIESGQEVTRDGVKLKEGPRSRVQQVIYGDNPGVTRGSRPDIQLMEEMGDWSTGKGDLKSCIGASKGSWRVGAIQKCRVFMIGTGGSVASDQAKDVFVNPVSYDLLPIQDFNKKACFFMPSDYMLGGMGWEETAVNDNESSRKWLEEERERTKNDMEIHTKLIQEYPFTIDEAFRKMGTNIFNQKNIARQWSLIEIGDESIKKPERGFLDWTRTPSGAIKGIKWSPNPNGDIEIIEHPYRGQSNKEVFANLYVGGVD